MGSVNTVQASVRETDIFFKYKNRKNNTKRHSYIAQEISPNC